VSHVIMREVEIFNPTMSFSLFMNVSSRKRRESSENRKVRIHFIGKLSHLSKRFPCVLSVTYNKHGVRENVMLLQQPNSFGCLVCLYAFPDGISIDNKCTDISIPFDVKFIEAKPPCNANTAEA